MKLKIAVTYENGKVFQHFGRTERFKVYETEDKTVKAVSLLEADGVGHGALAGLLKAANVETLICGGLGGGAMMALQEAGIQVIAGASGDTDEAVRSFMAGTLVSSGANCHHHDHGEGHSCGHHEGGCGHACH